MEFSGAFRASLYEERDGVRGARRQVPLLPGSARLAGPCGPEVGRRTGLQTGLGSGVRRVQRREGLLRGSVRATGASPLSVSSATATAEPVEAISRDCSWGEPFWVCRSGRVAFGDAQV